MCCSAPNPGLYVPSVSVPTNVASHSRQQWHRWEFWTYPCRSWEGPSCRSPPAENTALQGGEGSPPVQALSLGPSLCLSQQPWADLESIQKLLCPIYSKEIGRAWREFGNIWRGERTSEHIFGLEYFSLDSFWAISHLGMFARCLKTKLISLCFHCQHVRLWYSVYTNLFCPLCLTVSDLQEEGKNAINTPLSPAFVDIHPEDTQLGTGTVTPASVTSSCESRASAACSRIIEAAEGHGLRAS